MLKAHFFWMFIRVNLTFFPQHFLGLAGMPRRYLDYPDTMRLWHNISTVGSTMSAIGMFWVSINAWEAMVSCRPAIFFKGRNRSLEWRQSLPPTWHAVNLTPKTSY